MTHHGVFTYRMPLELHGVRATALGVAAISIAMFLHFHYFWGNVFHLAAWAVLGKILSLIGFITSVGYLLVRVGIFGEN